MGTGASRNPVVGVPANPRLIYAQELAKKNGQNVLIDAPVLVDVEHGSIRYRSDKDATQMEKPHEGLERAEKKNYFYHARLKDFNKDTATAKDNKFKFLYVSQAPNNAKQKQLYYVYGIGFGAQDGTKVNPSRTRAQGDDYAWPMRNRKLGDMYYDLTFMIQDAELPVDEDIDLLVDDIDSTPDKSIIQMKLKDLDMTYSLRKRLAVKLLKGASDIHICFREEELRSEDVISDLRKPEDGDWKIFMVELKLI